MTPRILAIDTTTEFGSLALVEDGQVVEELLLHSTEGFGHLLFPHLGRLLEKHGWELSNLDCLAAASGPGSFTGVRIGLAAAKGLAQTLAKPLAAVSNLEALAWFGTAALRAVMLDARRGEIYGAVYSPALDVISPEVVARFPVWIETLPEGDLEFVATNFAPFQPALAGTRFEGVPVHNAPRALAGAVGKIASKRFERGNVCDPAGADANYVRRSDAELLWKDR